MILFFGFFDGIAKGTEVFKDAVGINIFRCLTLFFRLNDLGFRGRQQSVFCGTFFDLRQIFGGLGYFEIKIDLAADSQCDRIKRLQIG